MVASEFEKTGVGWELLEVSRIVFKLKSSVSDWVVFAFENEAEVLEVVLVHDLVRRDQLVIEHFV